MEILHPILNQHITNAIISIYLLLLLLVVVVFLLIIILINCMLSYTSTLFKKNKSSLIIQCLIC